MKKHSDYYSTSIKMELPSYAGSNWFRVKGGMVYGCVI